MLCNFVIDIFSSLLPGTTELDFLNTLGLSGKIVYR